MMPSPTSHQTPHVRLPFQFIVVGIVAFVVAQLLIWQFGHHLLNGTYRHPAIWATAHVFLIGWATIVSMGAMYQMVPVVFQVRIHSERLGHWQFYVLIVGLLGFSYALFSFQTMVMIVFGTLLVLGILLFIVNMWLTLKNVAERSILFAFVASAVASLTLTIVLGLALVLQLTIGIYPADWHMPLLFTHITFGVVGWFSLLIFGFSYKMVPMFSLSHGYSMDLAPVVYGLFHLGLILTIVSYFVAERLVMFAGAIMLLVAFGMFSYHMWLILKKRMKKHPDLGFKYALYAIIGGLICAVGFVALLGSLSMEATASATHGGLGFIALTYLFLMGWVSLSILGYLFKIIPFLWWTHRYSERIGKESVPTLKDMMNESVGRWLFPGLVIGLLLVTIAIWLGHSTLFIIGQSAVVLFSMVYMGIILAVFRK